MVWYEDVKCPYCEHRISIGNEDFDGSDEIDIECDNEECEREFTVIREWEPTFRTQEISFCECEECGKEDRDDNMYWISDNEYLCRSCYFKKEIEKLK